MRFSVNLLFILNAGIGEEKRREGVGWEPILNQEESQSVPDTCHVGLSVLTVAGYVMCFPKDCLKC